MVVFLKMNEKKRYYRLEPAVVVVKEGVRKTKVKNMTNLIRNKIACLRFIQQAHSQS